MAAEAKKVVFGERPAGFEPLEVLLPRLAELERPEYWELLATYQEKAGELLVLHRVYENLGLLPIEEDFFYGQFLKLLVARPKGFDPRRLNLASWIQEKGVEYFQRYCLGLGVPAQIPPLFRWHYAYFDRVGEIADLLQDQTVSAEEKEKWLRAMAQEGRITELRERARELVSRRWGQG